MGLGIIVVLAPAWPAALAMWNKPPGEHRPLLRLCETGLLKVNVLVGPGSLVPHPSISSGSRPVAQLGANAFGEILEPGRVPDCYLGLRLDPGGHDQTAGVLVVAPAALLHPAVPQPDGTVLYELLTGHPDRAPGELVFLADRGGATAR
jgi:hypothetical protein